MPDVCKPHPLLPNVWIDDKNIPVASAWIVVTDEEGDANLKERVCFPRRICVTMGKPISPIAKYLTRVASCAVEIAGRLYVISANVGLVASSVDGTRDGETWSDSTRDASDRGPKIKECMRLGRVVYQSVDMHFIVIEVADTFKACRDPRCPRRPMLINNKWAMNKPSPSGTGPVQLALGKWDRGFGDQPPYRIKFVIDLEQEGRNSTIPDHCTHHKGEIRVPVDWDLNRLSQADAGSLVSCSNRAIGIVDYLLASPGGVRVLLFENKLWVHLAPYLNASWRRQDAFSVTQAWKHLEF
ncbi:hypothetical protein ANO14919_035730 [Xylariales sp. No.14919]|nr:hypothetical protein ANO14919_035730 [Xylariales sp. No.14919]